MQVGYTSLMYAVDSHHYEVAELLLRNKAHVNGQNKVMRGEGRVCVVNELVWWIECLGDRVAVVVRDDVGLR
jgi:hypothetical protein